MAGKMFQQPTWRASSGTRLSVHFEFVPCPADCSDLLQAALLNQPFPCQFPPLRICFDELPATSPERVNELDSPTLLLKFQSMCTKSKLASSTTGHVFRFDGGQVRTERRHVQEIIALGKRRVCRPSYPPGWDVNHVLSRTPGKACGTGQAGLHSHPKSTTVQIHLLAPEFR